MEPLQSTAVPPWPRPLDAVRLGYRTTVRLDLVAGVALGTTDATLQRMREAGVRLQ